MAIRITGMYSGLDTESIINELASAQSTKKNNLVKKQTRLSWKQDAWKALNTKIYNFYTNVVDNMRFQASFLKKTTKVSNSNAVSVVTSNDAPNSVQSMKISQLAKEAYLTSGQLKRTDGKAITTDTKLSELDGFSDGSFRVKAGSKTTDIKLSGDMKISDVVKKLQNAGINASFDAKQQRFYLSSKNSGAAADFTITSNDATGKNVLAALGLMTSYNKDSSEYKEYKKWADYGTGTPPTQARTDAEAAEVAKLIASKKSSTDSLLKANEELEKKLERIKKQNEDNDNYDIDYDEDDPSKINEQVEKLYTQLYGEKVQKEDDEGNPMVDDNGDPIWETERSGQLSDGSDSLKTKVDNAKEALKNAEDNLAALKKSGASADDISAAQADVDSKKSQLTTAQSDFNKVKGQYSYVKATADAQNAIEANKETIDENRSYYVTDTNGDAKLDENGKLQATSIATQEVTDYFTEKIKAAQAYITAADDYMNKSDNYDSLNDADKAAFDAMKAQMSQMATKIDGQDAQISLNGVQYTSKTNTFEINGLTITAQQETGDEEITLSTVDDTDSIFDMVKNFFTEYNKLINEMDKLYNADANKDYDPLLSEEKEAMSDTEIEEWENKVKESLLRRDSTLSTVSGAMKTIMLAGVEVGGKKMYLSDFGINTLGYFNAGENEKNAYHINGDPDDASTKAEDNILKAMIASDPDTVMKFFTGLSNSLHDKLNELMASSTSSSAFTVYNDKDMKEEYDDYTEKISKQETKVNNLIDKWYQKFSKMETALAKLESKSNAVAGMLGG